MRAGHNLLDLQRPGGDWEGEMVWCTMILAQAIIVRTIVGRPYSESERQAIERHFELNQRADGSWGMHPESEGYVFFTALGYIALRLLGVPADRPILRSAATWLHHQPGGVKTIPSWGKFWLAMLGLYPYDALNSIPPELFLLPESLPFHPRRYYCHTRQIYLGIAYLYGRRFVAEIGEELRDALRGELYPEASYETIDFGRFRHAVAASDAFVPISRLLRVIYDALHLYERHGPKPFRDKALDRCFERVLFEQRTTAYQGISPVSGLLNCLAIHCHDPQHPDLPASLDGVEAWRWEDAGEGIRYVGARSNTWDTAFAVQALCEHPDAPAQQIPALRAAHAFLDRAQSREEIPDRDYGWRDTAVGGWCFSNGQHRWPVSDCAAEAVSALLSMYEHPKFPRDLRLDPAWLQRGIAFLLSRQNDDGGFGTYERRRAGRLLEAINPSEMFGQCMTELSYIECTSSAVAALAHYRKHAPDSGATTIDTAIARALAFLRTQQKSDGSFTGFWGINYTYAAFHVAKAFRTAGIAANDPVLQAAAAWLIAKQREDGGWGEHYRSCLVNEYVEHPTSQPVMTSWALLALMDIVPAEHPAIRRGIDWLASQAAGAGACPRGAVNGVFFGAAMLDYRLYHDYFPAWALAKYVRATAQVHSDARSPTRDGVAAPAATTRRVASTNGSRIGAPSGAP
ncbi:MAG: 2,3-oxidosqualene cyclase [Methylotetracoccus sp.]